MHRPALRRPRRAFRPSMHLSPVTRALAAAGLLAAPLWLQAQVLPQGLSVVQGQAIVATQGALMTVKNSPGAILNWNSFNIGAGAGVHFDQVNAASKVLNRVIGSDPSAILGSLSSNGQVWLLNPNGVLFGQGARVDVAGLVASTLRLNDGDFAAGRYRFSAADGDAGTLRNEGSLRSSFGGQIVLLGSRVENAGEVDAPGGQASLAAARSIDLVDTGLPRLAVRVQVPGGEAVNLGRLAAAGGLVDIYAGIVNQQGLVQVDTASIDAQGRVRLQASESLTLGKDSRTTATGGTEGLRGGDIQIEAPVIDVLRQAVVDASGAAGGGRVRVGGGLHGEDADMRNAQAVAVAPGARLSADALAQGDGGSVVVWSDVATRFAGAADARGGPRGGNGGTVEVSGQRHLDFLGSSDRAAPLGRAGLLLLDPQTLDINASAPNIDGSPGNDLTAGNLLSGDFPGINSVITAGAVQGQLAVGPVLLQAVQGITVNAPITSATTNSLTLEAGSGITVNSGAPITTNGAITLSASTPGIPGHTTTDAVTTFASIAAGSGSVLTITNGGGTGAHNAFNNAVLSGGALVLNGDLFMSGLLNLSGFASTSGSGTIDVNGTLDIRNGAVINNPVTVSSVDTITSSIGGGTLAGSTIQIDGSGSFRLAGGASSTLTVSSTIPDAVGGPGSLVITGGTVVLSGNNTYSGTTTVNSGTLKLGNVNALGATNGGTTVQAGATLDLNGPAFYPAEAITLNGSGVGGAGALVNTGSSGATLTGVITLGSNATVGGPSTIVLAGQVTGPGGLTKVGLGSYTYLDNPANDYAGDTLINGGVVAVRANGALGSTAGKTVVNPGGALQLDIPSGDYGTPEPVELNGGVLLSSNSPQALSGAVTLTAPSTIQTLGASASLTLNGSLGGTSGLTYLGSADLTLNGAIGAVPVTANAGRLIVNGTMASPSLALTPGALVATGLLSRFTAAPDVTVAGGAYLDMAGGETLGSLNGVSGAWGTVGLGATAMSVQSGEFRGTMDGLGSLVKTGPGVFTLGAPGANRYSGGTRIDAGTLRVVGPGIALGTGPIDLAGGTLDVASGAVLGNSVNVGSGLISNSSGTGEISGPVVGSAISTSVSGLGLTLSGVVSGGSVDINGPGTTTFSGTNAYTGATTVSTGTLALQGSSITGPGAVTIASGASLNLSAGARIAAPLLMTGATLSVPSGSSLLGGALSLTDTTVDVSSGATLAASGALTAGGVLTKAGGGLFALQSGVTATGTTALQAGTLAFNGPTGLNNLQLGGGSLDGSGAVTVGGFLDASYGPVSLAGTGTLTTQGFALVQLPGAGGSVDVNKPWVNSGTLSLFANSTLRLNTAGQTTGSLTNTASGLFNIDSLLPDAITGSGPFVNAGAIDFTSFSSAITVSSFINSGQIDVQGGTLSVVTPSLQNPGILRVNNGGTLGTSTSFTNESTGVVGGRGTLVVASGTGTFTNRGALVPGGNFSGGMFTVTGNVDLADGTLLVALGGTGAGQSGQLAVGGNLALGGQLNASLLAGYAPAQADAIPLITYGGARSGTAPLLTLPAGFTGGFNLAPGEALRAIYNNLGGTLVFSNAAGDLNWATPANWGGSLPGALDGALISGGYGVTHNTGADTISSLTVGSGNALSVGGGSLTVTGTTALGGSLAAANGGQLTLQGAVTGTGTASLSFGGQMTFNGATALSSLALSGGQIDGTGSLTVNGNFSRSGGTMGSGYSLVDITQASGDLHPGALSAGTVRLSTQDAAGRLVVDNTVGATGAMDINAAGGLQVLAAPVAAALTAGGNQTITAASVLVQVGTASSGVGARISANGNQSITVSGNGSLAVLGGSGQNNAAQITAQGLSQSIVGHGGPLVITGGSGGGGGNAAVISAGNASASTVQSVSGFSSVQIIGGAAGANNNALLTSSAGSQSLSAGALFLQGGANGTGNDAVANAPAGSQTVNITGDASLTAGAGGAGNSVVLASPTQALTVGGNLTLQGGASAATGGLYSDARIGGPNNGAGPGSVVLNVGGNLVMTGGSNGSGALIGYSAAITQDTTIAVTAGGDIRLNPGAQAGSGTRIGSVVGGTLAGGDISLSAPNGTMLMNGNFNGGVAAEVNLLTSGRITLNALNLDLGSAISGQSVQARASNLLQLRDAALLSATATSGDSMILRTGAGGFDNTAGAGVLSVAGSARWLGYAPDATLINAGGLVAAFKQYAAPFGTTPAASGNGLLLALAPTLTATLQGTASKVYDATSAATLAPANFALTGVQPSDTVAFTSVTSGSYASKNVGSGKTVTAGGLAATFTDTATGVPVYGYAFSGTAAGAVGTITPATLSLAGLAAQDKTYDGTTAATLAGALAGVRTGDTVSLALGGSFADAGAGAAKPVAYSATTGGADAGNYSLVGASGRVSASILPATLTYRADTLSQNVGLPIPVLSGTVTGFIGTETLASSTTGALLFTTPATASTAAGSYPIVGSGLLAANYVFIQAPGNAQALTLTGQFTADPTSATSTTTLTQTLQTVQVPPSMSAPSTGRVLDVTPMMSTGASADPVTASTTVSGTGSSPSSVSTTPVSTSEPGGPPSSTPASLPAAAPAGAPAPEAERATAVPASASSTPGPSPASSGVGFQAVNFSMMARADVQTLLAARDQFKKQTLAASLAKIEQDPKLADVRPCVDEAEVAGGSCLLTPELRQKIQDRVARARAQPGHPDHRRVIQAAVPSIERKLAVLIGINQYVDKRIPTLSGSIPDARAIRQLLESRLGYETVIVEDGSREAIVRALNTVALEAGSNDSVIVYYAGHGVVVPVGGVDTGFWLPADGNAEDPSTWLSNADIGRLVSAIGSKQLMLVSDSCYSGTLAGSERVQVDRGAAALDLLARRAAVVLSSGGNEPVADEGRDGHSVFAWHFMRALENLNDWQVGSSLFERVRAAVVKDFPQTPQYGASRSAGHQGNTDYLFERRELEAQVVR